MEYTLQKLSLAHQITMSTCDHQSTQNKGYELNTMKIIGTNTVLDGKTILCAVLCNYRNLSDKFTGFTTGNSSSSGEAFKYRNISFGESSTNACKQIFLLFCINTEYYFYNKM